MNRNWILAFGLQIGLVFSSSVLGQPIPPCFQINLVTMETRTLGRVPPAPELCGTNMFSILRTNVVEALRAIELPNISASTPVSRDELRALATHFRLTHRTGTNSHLSFLRGDISYWQEEALPWRDYVIQFASRSVVLDAADQCGVIVGDQGVLSWAAERYMPFIREAINKGIVRGIVFWAPTEGGANDAASTY